MHIARIYREDIGWDIAQRVSISLRRAAELEVVPHGIGYFQAPEWTRRYGIDARTGIAVLDRQSSLLRLCDVTLWVRLSDRSGP